MKRALITGITGQDGSYLAQLLLGKGYAVAGVQRRHSAGNELWRLQKLGIDKQVVLISGDLLDVSSLANAITQSEPDEIYNLAAQSFVTAAFAQPLYTAAVTGFGAANLLEACRLTGFRGRYYQASSSEMFGGLAEGPLNAKSAFHPRSPYASAKVFAHHFTVNYREAYGLQASCGIMFNHESPLRGEEFVTRKVCRAAVEISLGRRTWLELGNLNARRDWGYAPDYVRAMWMMLQQPVADDYVIGTGRNYSIQELCQTAFEHVGVSWECHVRTDASLLRSLDVPSLCASTTDWDRLGWRPSITFHEMIRKMVESEIERFVPLRNCRVKGKAV